MILHPPLYPAYGWGMHVPMPMTRSASATYFVDFNGRSPAGLADKNILGRLGVMDVNAPFKALKCFLSHFFGNLFLCGRGMGSPGADCRDALVRHSGLVQAVQNRGNCELRRRRPLHVVKQQRNLHPGSGKLLQMAESLSDCRARAPLPLPYPQPKALSHSPGN